MGGGKLLTRSFPPPIASPLFKNFEKEEIEQNSCANVSFMMRTRMLSRRGASWCSRGGCASFMAGGDKPLPYKSPHRTTANAMLGGGSFFVKNRLVVASPCFTVTSRCQVFRGFRFVCKCGVANLCSIYCPTSCLYKGHTCQPTASRERPRADGRHARRNRYACQASTSTKRIRADGRQLAILSKRNACQATASSERNLADGHHTVWKFDVFKTSAFVECTVADAYCIRTQCYRSDTSITIYDPFINVGYTIFYLNQIIASKERISADVRHT